MCGITGWIDWNEDLSQKREMLELMTARLQHRGPDAQGIWLSPRAAFGQRRLSVIDPENGLQPMVFEEGDFSCVITYNGEIYNFLELRKELESYGHKFRTNSDTEVLLHSYVKWGEDCVYHLNGIFAFGLWDNSKQKLMLARDHLGVKPLFYAERGSAVLFASEIKSMLENPLVQPEVDKEGLAEVFGFLQMHTPGYTVFRNVHEVRPGTYIVFDRNGKRTTKYWSLPSRPHVDDVDTTVERVKELLNDTVKRQLISDVPLVTMLSGGLDSSGLTALAAREFRKSGKQLHTYSMDFAESEQHFKTNPLYQSLDAPWAKRVSEYADTNHHIITFGAQELLDNLLEPMRAHDHPGIGQLESSLVMLFKEMKKDATVALSGESADEVFGGYPWYQLSDIESVSGFPWLIPYMRKDSLRKLYMWLSEDAHKEYNPLGHISRRYQESLEEVPHLPGEDKANAKRREMFYMNLTRLLPTLLDRKDRMSMAAGFEVRVPYCDYRIVEYVWNIPWDIKTVDGSEKDILRRALADVLPDDVRCRRKSGYPANQHPEYLNGVKEWVLQIFNDPNEPLAPFVNRDAVKVISRAMNRRFPNVLSASFYERIIQTNEWLKEYHIKLC